LFKFSVPINVFLIVKNVEFFYCTTVAVKFWFENLGFELTEKMKYTVECSDHDE
jgi:hypothetical protein